MPIPTSLIIVLLVVAWLAVLVPMVARRREHVPQAAEDGVRFRVLRRASASLRRRPGARAAEIDESEEEDLFDEGDTGELDEELLDDESDGDFDDSGIEYEETVEEEVVVSAPVRPSRRSSSARAAVVHDPEPAGYEPAADPRAVGSSRYEPVADPRAVGSSRYEPEPERTYQAQAAVAVESRPVGSSRYGAAEQQHQDEQYPADRYQDDHYQDDRYQDDRYQDDREDPRYRPVPQRRGRGGYDPEAAEAMRAYKYKRRRRVTLFLLLATILFSVAAYSIKPVLWSGTAIFGLLLIGYLAYLRRQVRIEESIRQRRLAKLRQARQVRPTPHISSAHGPVAPPSAAPVAAPTRRGRIVDLDDDDPAFEDLEYYQPIAYRRASGQ